MKLYNYIWTNLKDINDIRQINDMWDLVQYKVYKKVCVCFHKKQAISTWL